MDQAQENLIESSHRWKSGVCGRAPAPKAILMLQENALRPVFPPILFLVVFSMRRNNGSQDVLENFAPTKDLEENAIDVDKDSISAVQSFCGLALRTLKRSASLRL